MPLGRPSRSNARSEAALPITAPMTTDLRRHSVRERERREHRKGRLPRREEREKRKHRESCRHRGGFTMSRARAGVASCPHVTAAASMGPHRMLEHLRRRWLSVLHLHSNGSAAEVMGKSGSRRGGLAPLLGDRWRGRSPSPVWPSAAAGARAGSCAWPSAAAGVRAGSGVALRDDRSTGFGGVEAGGERSRGRVRPSQAWIERRDRSFSAMQLIRTK